MKKIYSFLVLILFCFAQMAVANTPNLAEEDHPYPGWPINQVPADAEPTYYLASGYFYTYTIEVLSDVQIVAYDNGDGNIYFHTLFPHMMSLQYDESLAEQNIPALAPIVGKKEGNVISIPKQHFFHWYYSYEGKTYELYFSAAKVENGKVVELDDDLRFEILGDGTLQYILADGMRHAYYGAFDETGKIWLYNADLTMVTNPNNLSVIPSSKENESIYDLCGRRLSAPKGLYIANGKKFIR